MKLFVWDFHGTLEKGNEFAVLEMSNLVLDKHGYKEKFSESQCRELYGKKWFEYFEYLLPNESKSKHLELQKDCFSFSASHPEIIAKYIKSNDYAIQVLEAIQQRHDQILVSNTTAVSLSIFMNAVGVVDYFPSGKAFAIDAHTKNKTKQAVLKKYLQQNKFEEVIVVGDSASDVELGRVVGATTFLYAHPGLEFKNYDSDFQIRDLREVLKAL